MKEKKERDSRYELLRIVSMLLIILWHIIQHTNALNNSSGTFHYLISFVFILISVHVNSFVMITGYYQYNKKVKYKKVLYLLGVVLFYNIAYEIINIYVLHKYVTPLDILEDTSILNLNNYWFINYYIILYLISPLLNKFIEHTTKKEHKNILIIMFICFDLIPFITGQKAFSNNGLTIIGFIFIYIVGAYFAKYPIRESECFKKFSNNKLRVTFLVLFLFTSFLNFINYQFGESLATSNNEILRRVSDIITSQIIGYSNPFLFFQTIFYFLYFGELNIKSKIINSIGKITFGVYLVHENKVVYNNLYSKIFAPITNNTPSRVFFKMIVIAIIIFVASIIVEYIRKGITILLGKLKIVKRIKVKLSNYFGNF